MSRRASQSEPAAAVGTCASNLVIGLEVTVATLPGPNAAMLLVGFVSSDPITPLRSSRMGYSDSQLLYNPRYSIVVNIDNVKR